ncbi:MAG: efflux RND transporter periplasmic adaptor subunit [Gemmatimonadetes bacterium]|nr:efflux RND transporter periplasmic adaptor subunit [Gemmatimonadota bacterium]
MTDPTVLPGGGPAGRATAVPDLAPGHRLARAAVVAALVLTATVPWLAWRRSHGAAADERARVADVAGGPLVRTTTVAVSPPARTLSLLGEARPWASVTLYAKVSGYLRSVQVDKGDRVHAGQVLAEIESPEIDRAWQGAKAEHDNKVAVAARMRTLLEKKLVSPQEAEQAITDAAVAGERLSALAAQREYETLRAPFDGTVTERFADAGALVQSATSSQTSAQPVCTVTQVSRLRVYVYLDQADAAAVHRGIRATVSVAERPGFRRLSEVSRVSGELDPRTRKMLAEVDVDDADQAIVPGGFVQVELEVPMARLPAVPVEALLTRDGQSMVAVVAPDSTIRLQAVHVAANDGKLVTLSSGVAAGTPVVMGPGAWAVDGARVRPAATGRTP